MNARYNNLVQQIPPVTLNLLIINFLCWIAQLALPRIGVNLDSLLGLHYLLSDDFHVWQPLTYMFLHGSFSHLFFNMFALFMFGLSVEQMWGSKRYLIYYIVCGLSAAFCQEIVWYLETGLPLRGYEMVSFADGFSLPVDMYLNQLLTIGASGAVFGLLLAFGWLFPNAGIFIMFIPIPVKAKYFVVIYGVIELFLGVSGMQSGVAHFAHLGGMIGGLLLILLWRKRGILHRDSYNQYDY